MDGGSYGDGGPLEVVVLGVAPLFTIHVMLSVSEL